MNPKLIAVLLTAALPATAQARNIVISNDDGLSSNVKALYDALKAQGHDVIVSVPCANQSGMGAAIRFMRELGPLTADCRNDAAKAGSPGAGPMTRADLGRDYFYVDGTPVMATLYGIDIAAQTRWGKAPDLVISGPNEGQNIGYIVLTSGTVSNVQYAGTRGIPAIAMSGGMDTMSGPALDNAKSAMIAARGADLVAQLDARAKGGPLLPAGVVLNVNFPDTLEGAKWRQTRIGTYSGFKVRFVPDLSTAGKTLSPEAHTSHGPGITASQAAHEPKPEERNDESYVVRTDIAVSPMQIGYDPAPGSAAPVGKWLADTLKGLK